MQENTLQPAAPRPQTSQGMIIVLVLLAMLVIIGGAGIGLYTTVLHTKEQQIQATTVVQNLLSAQAKATRVTSPQYIYTQITSKKPTLDDPLNSQHSSWTNGGDQQGNGCTFTGGAFHIHLTTLTGYICHTKNSSYRNFIFQVQITIMSGVDGGFFFRSPVAFKGYYFILTSDGQYTFGFNTSSNSQILIFDRSSTANTGLNRSNLLTVLAQGNTISLYINKQFVKSFHDDTFQSGSIGLITSNPKSLADVAFSNAQLWEL
jgi:hypothetical protein